MRVKLFKAPTLRAAISLLREELGSDALLLSSREVAGGVEVTAAVEPEDTAEFDLERFDEVPAPPPDQSLVASFVWHNLLPILVDALSPRIGESLADACARKLVFRPTDAEAILVCGAAGSGRTSSIVALARRQLLAGGLPMVITADRRPGAAEALAAATRALGLTLIVADHPETLRRALARREAETTVLIDTPPLDAFSAGSAAAIAALAQTARATPMLTLAAGTDPLEAAEFACAAQQHVDGLDRLVITRFDSSGRLGGPLAACLAGELGLAAALCGTAGLHDLTPDLLAARLAQRRVSMEDLQTASPPAATEEPPPVFSHRHAALICAHIAAQQARR